MRCMKCGKEVNDELTFCPVCGNELHKNQKYSNKADYFLRCPVCGKEYLYEMNHCIECVYKTEAYQQELLRLQRNIESYKPVTKYVPKCPTCGSTNLKRISSTQKATNAVLFGLFGNKRSKQFHCNNCGYEW